MPAEVCRRFSFWWEMSKCKYWRGQNEWNAYTFVEKGRISVQSVKRVFFKVKKQALFWLFEHNVVILQPNSDKMIVKVRII